MGEQHRLGPLEVGVARQVGVGRRPACSARSSSISCSVDHAAGDDATARAWSYSRRSVATWSLRLRPVCSLAPAAPASSVTRRSTAVWMSSSRRRTRTASRQLVVRPRSSASSTASPRRRRADRPAPSIVTCARDPAMSSRPHPPIERQADRVREQFVGRAAGEAAVPERLPAALAPLGHRRPFPTGSPASSRNRSASLVPPSDAPPAVPRRRRAACRHRRRCRARRPGPSDRAPSRRRGRSRAGCG